MAQQELKESINWKVFSGIALSAVTSDYRWSASIPCYMIGWLSVSRHVDGICMNRNRITVFSSQIKNITVELYLNSWTQSRLFMSATAKHGYKKVVFQAPSQVTVHRSGERSQTIGFLRVWLFSYFTLAVPN